MRLGLVMPVCTTHAMQEEAWASARMNSRPDTPFYVLFNGIEPRPLPDGITSIHIPNRFEDEADLWNYCLCFAQVNAWDWCMVIHDDFKMVDPGWEDDLAQSGKWRVALAGWCVYADWDVLATPTIPASTHLGVCIDSLSFGFKVDVFSTRGYVTLPAFGYGYGAWDANFWALREGYGVWKILLNSWHQWIDNENTRTKLKVKAPGAYEIREKYKNDVLPARVVDSEHIETHGRIIRIAP